MSKPKYDGTDATSAVGSYEVLTSYVSIDLRMNGSGGMFFWFFSFMAEYIHAKI